VPSSNKMCCWNTCVNMEPTRPNAWMHGERLHDEASPSPRICAREAAFPRPEIVNPCGNRYRQDAVDGRLEIEADGTRTAAAIDLLRDRRVIDKSHGAVRFVRTGGKLSRRIVDDPRIRKVPGVRRGQERQLRACEGRRRGGPDEPRLIASATVERSGAPARAGSPRATEVRERRVQTVQAGVREPPRSFSATAPPRLRPLQPAPAARSARRRGRGRQESRGVLKTEPAW